MAKRNSVETDNPYKPNNPVNVILWLLVLTIAPLQVFPTPKCYDIYVKEFSETKRVD